MNKMLWRMKLDKNKSFLDSFIFVDFVRFFGFNFYMRVLHSKWIIFPGYCVLKMLQYIKRGGKRVFFMQVKISLRYLIFPLRISPSHCSCPPRNPRTGRRMNRNWPKNTKRRSKTYRKRGKSTERSASRIVKWLLVMREDLGLWLYFNCVSIDA